jgi:hypothetical protein
MGEGGGGGGGGDVSHPAVSPPGRASPSGGFSRSRELFDLRTVDCVGILEGQIIGRPS